MTDARDERDADAPEGATPDDAVVPDDLAHHVPSNLARRRAERAGMDLDALRSEAPDRYRMLNAEEIASVSPELADAAAQVVWDAFPDRAIYRVPAPDAGPERLLAFPPLDAEALARFDDDAADLVAKPEFEAVHAFFRTVNDLRGTRRELMLPTPPDAWAGEIALVGPFATQAEAEAWPAGRLPDQLIADPVPYRGVWFCDVFRSDEELLFPSGGSDAGES
ncbi:MAG: hypothetical protein WD336_07975 [Trueperaceae bacterium]